MAKQITLKNLQDVAQRTKQYIDDKGGAMVYRTETVLFDGEASVSSANNLNQSLANFDAVRIVASAKNTTDGSLWAMIEQEFGIDELTNSSPKMSATEYSNTSGTGATAAGGYTLTLLFTDTTFSITRTGNSNWTTHNPTIRKIYGINYVPIENYSTTEQVVGTWIDGRPVYQKTIDFGQLPDTSTKIVSTGLDNSTRMIEAYGMAYRPSDGANFPIPLVAEMDNLTAQMPLYFRLNSNNIYDAYIHTSIDRTAFTECYITIKYTKASS